MKKVIAEISARHLHISRAHLDKLYGKGYKLRPIKELSQPGEFGAQEKVEVVGPKNSIMMRIVGPTRRQTQIELAATDARTLGVRPEFRVSGDLKGTPGGVTLKGPKGSVKLTTGVIVPLRHLHISTEQAKKWKLKTGQKVKARVGGPRGLILENIVVRVGNFHTNIHLDTDEGNASGLLSCSKVDLLV